MNQGATYAWVPSLNGDGDGDGMLKEALGGWAGGICGVDQENDTSLRSINRLAAQLKDGPVLTSHRGFGLDDGLGPLEVNTLGT
jgi:hypothetical protein